MESASRLEAARPPFEWNFQRQSGSAVRDSRILPGTLPGTAFEVRADATVAGAALPEATVIARSAGRVRIEGDELDFTEPAEPPVKCWDGTSTWLVAADWSVRQGPRRP